MLVLAGWVWMVFGVGGLAPVVDSIDRDQRDTHTHTHTHTHLCESFGGWVGWLAYIETSF